MENISFVRSSGNIFEDLGLPEPKERLRKVDLVYQINSIIEARHLKQKDAAKVLGIPQSKISLLINGKLQGFSLEKLISFLEVLDKKIEINVTEPTDASIKTEQMLCPNGFVFPVVNAIHPFLALTLPKWDYSGEFCSC